MSDKIKKDSAAAPTELQSRAAPLIERAPLPILEVQGATHVVIYVNSAFCSLLGKSKKYLIGKTFDQIVCNGDKCREILDRVFQTGEAAVLAHEDDAESAHWLYAMWPALDANNQPERVIIQMTKAKDFRPNAVEINEALIISGLRQHEMTQEAEHLNAQLRLEIDERKEVETALRESEAFNRSIIESSPDCIKVLSLEGDLLSILQGADELLGIQDTQPYLNKSWMEFWTGRDREAATAAVKTAAAGGDGRFVGFFRTLRNEPKWWDVVITPILGANGKPTRLLAISRDVTERKQSEDALRESEVRYRTLFNLIDEGYSIIDLIYDENEKPVDWRFLDVNPAFEKLTGLHDVIGKRMREFVPNHETYWFEIYGEVVRTGEPVRFVNQAKDLDDRWFDLYAFPIGGPKSRKVAVLFTNITERRRGEQALRDSREEINQHAGELEKTVTARTIDLRHSVESLENLNYTMAHDLRAPIRAMRGLTEALMEDVPLNETGKDYAGKIIQAAARMDQLVNDLLDYGELSHLEFPVQALDLKSQIEKTLAQTTEIIQATQAEIHVAEPLPAVLANQTLLQQILTNLMLNALKFVAPGVKPKIKIWAEEKKSTAESQESRAGHSALDPRPSTLDSATIRLWIEDKGIGIPAEYQQKIFGVFQRLHTTDAYPGTGVGLAIIKRTVERMDGNVGVESEPGKGSRFWIELPKGSLVR